MTQTTLAQPINITLTTVKKYPKSQLDAKILAAFDESLEAFGESVRHVVYFHLKNVHQVNRCEIPSRIDEFAATIEEIFGVRAKLIEMKIMETLHARTAGFVYRPKDNNLIFRDYVQSLRHFMASSTN